MSPWHPYSKTAKLMTRAVRQKIARDHDWGEILSSLARTICDRLGPEYSERLRAMSLFSVLLC